MVISLDVIREVSGLGERQSNSFVFDSSVIVDQTPPEKITDIWTVTRVVSAEANCWTEAHWAYEGDEPQLFHGVPSLCWNWGAGCGGRETSLSGRSEQKPY